MRISELIATLKQIISDITDMAISYAYGEHTFINDDTGHATTIKAIRKDGEVIITYLGKSHTYESVDDTVVLLGDQALNDLLGTYSYSYLKWLERQEEKGIY